MENSGLKNFEIKIDLKDYIKRFFKSWLTLLICFLLCFSLAWLYIKYLAVPLYYVDSKILIEDPKSSGGGTANSQLFDLSDIFGSNSSVYNEGVILKTRSLMDTLVRKLNLNVIWYSTLAAPKQELFKSPFLLHVQTEDSLTRPFEFDIENVSEKSFDLSFVDLSDNKTTYEGLKFDSVFSNLYGTFAISRTLNAISSSSYNVVVNTIDNTVQSLAGKITAEVTQKGTTILDLQFSHTLRDKGEYILNNYISEYIRQNIRDKSKITDSTIKFIDDRIIKVNAELNGIEGSIQTFMQGKGIADLEAQSRLTLQSNSGLTDNLIAINSQISVIDSILNTLKDKDKKTLISGLLVNQGPQNDQGFNILVEGYNDLIMTKERLLLSYNEKNPNIVNINNRIDSSRSNIVNFLQNTKFGLSVKKTQLNLAINSFGGDIKQYPSRQREFLDLTRQQQLKQDLYLFLLQKREETALANTSNIAGIRVIDPPKADPVPYSPRNLLIWTIATFFTIVIPIGKLYLEDIFNTKIRDRKDIESRTSLPVVVELSHNVSGEDLIKFQSSRDPLSEQFRALRTNMQFLLANQESKVILVTSGMPGEGKSFTSINLANVYAAGGKKTLLLEFDLRKPKLSKTYKQVGVNRVGISNYIVNQTLTLDEIITSVGEEGELLYFGACGPIPPNPSELILSSKVEKLFKEAREKFDYIIVDAPPIGAVTDAQLLNKFCDATLFIVRSEYTPNDLVTLFEDIRVDGKIRNAAIILNDVRENSATYYGYRYGYYGEHEVRKSVLKNFFIKISKMIKR